MSFQLNRNLKFTNTKYDNRPILVGDIVYCQNETGYYIGRCHWIDKHTAKSLYIEDIAESFSVCDCRLANEKEREKYIWSKNYMYSYFYYESKVKTKHNKIKNIIGEIFCYLPIPFFGVCWLIIYGMANERLKRSENIIFLSLLFQIISTVLISVFINIY